MSWLPPAALTLMLPVCEVIVQFVAAGDLAADHVGILTADQLQVGVGLQFAGGVLLW